MTRKSCLAWIKSKWIQYGLLMVALCGCPTIFITVSAFNQVCIRVIPGAWFVAKIRLSVLEPGEFKTQYTAWSPDITVGFKACFLTTTYPDYSIITPQVTALGGYRVNCYPKLATLEIPMPGTYVYDTWGITTKVFCRGEESASSAQL